MTVVLDLTAHDAWEAGLSGAPNQPLGEWIRAHGVDPDDVRILRLHVRPDGSQHVEFDRLARNADGRRYVDPQTGDVAMLPPLLVPLAASVPKVVAHAVRA